MFAKEFQLALLLITNRSPEQQRLLEFLRRAEPDVKQAVLVELEEIVRRMFGRSSTSARPPDWEYVPWQYVADWSPIFEPDVMDKLLEKLPKKLPKTAEGTS